MIRLAHLSDIHFGGENVAALEAVTARLHAEPFDLVVISGDLTRFGEDAEFEFAARWLASLPEQRLVTPGNHDAPYIAWAERIVAPFRRFEKWIGPAPAQTFVGGGFAVRGVNTARGVQPRLNWSKGQISVTQARRAADWFDSVGEDCIRVVVVHHPLIEMLGGPMTAKVWGGEAAAKIFAEARVDMVLSGHIHAPFTWPYPQGDGRTYAVGAGTLSIRERGVPPSFNVVEIEDKCFRVQAMAWTGSHYEPHRTWSLDRRAK